MSTISPPTSGPGGATQVNKALSGNLLLVQINGTAVGYVQTITGQDDYSPEPLSGLGDIHVAEWVPTMARYTIQVDRMTLKTSSLMTVAGGQADTSAGSQGSGTGTAGGKGIWEDGYQMLQGFVFDILLMGNNPSPNQTPQSASSGTGGIFKKWTQCSFASGSVRIQKHQIVVEDATFNCTHVSGKHTTGA